MLRCALALLLSSLACSCSGATFQELTGFRCDVDADCGDALRCIRGVCGGADPGPVPAGGRVRPNATNTGVPATVVLSTTEGQRVTEPSTVIEGLDIHGSLLIEADDVTVRRCRIRGDSMGVISIAPGVKRTVIEDSELGPTPRAGVVGDDFVARRLHLDTGTAFLGARDSTIDSSWYAPTVANNGSFVHVLGGSRTVIAGNACDSAGTACVFAESADAPLLDLLIDGNWLNGGVYTLNLGGGPNGEPKNTRILDNHFGEDFSLGRTRLSGTWRAEGNVRASNGLPLSF